MSDDSQPSIKTIADLDDLIQTSADSPCAITSLNPLELRFLEQSSIQGNLLKLKRLFREHPAVEREFAAIRECQLHAASNNSSSAARAHLTSYTHAFGNLNYIAQGNLGGGRIRTFLDLGCSPGGFSTWVLTNNRSAKGVGITLPDADAKFSMSDDTVRAFEGRYHVHFEDLNTLAMRGVNEDRNPLADPVNQAGLGLRSDTFELVIAGAFPTLLGRIPWFTRARLVFSQLLIALSTIAQGGSCVVCINSKPFLWIVDAIGMLRGCFSSIIAGKGGKLHAVRTSCYLVCRGFEATEDELRTRKLWLQDVLRRLDDMSKAHAEMVGDPESQLGEDEQHDWDQDGECLEESLPLFSGQSMSEIFETQHRFILDLFEPVWASQYNAIRDRFDSVLRKDIAGEIGACRCPSSRSRAGSAKSLPVAHRKSSISTSSSSGSPTTPSTLASPPHSPVSYREQDSPDSSHSPYVPKWRPPQRRKTFSAGPADANTWRRRSMDSPEEAPPSATTQEAAMRPVYSQRRFSCFNTTNAETSGSWRAKK